MAGSESTVPAASGDRGRRTRRAAVAGVAVLVVAMACVVQMTVTHLRSSGSQSTVSAHRDPLATVTGGRIRGMTEGTTDQFLGVPYAAPPTGDLRWRSPRPVVPWTGVRTAQHRGPDCPQATNGDSDGSLSENCLYLNVYRPAGVDPGAKLPVIVFIHGGGYTGGTPNVYDGTRLASTREAIVVIPAYRLGLFGFFGTLGTAKEGMFGEQGNWGTQDQQASLRWVQRNIGSLGGDPGRVTIAGESAGANSVCFQLASPQAQGLFQRAIIESGYGGCAEPSTSTGSSFAKQLGCDPSDMTCLRALPAAKLVGAATGFNFAQPVSGGPDQPVPSDVALRTGRIADVPIVMGTNEDEYATFLLGLYPESPTTYATRIKAQFGEQVGAQVLQHYPSNYRHASLGSDAIYAEGAVTTDSLFACSSARIADQVSANGQRVYYYEFADRSAPRFRSYGDPAPSPTIPLGAYHTAELGYLFGYQDQQRPLNADQDRLADQLAAYWVGFAASGRPTAAHSPTWPAYSADRSRVLQFDTPGRGGSDVIDNYGDSHQCAFWDAR